MASLDWSQCKAVESIPGKVSGAWVFKGTRTPVAIVFENLEGRIWAGRKIAIVILGKGRWRLIRKRLPEIAAAVAAATPGSLVEVEIPDE